MSSPRYTAVLLGLGESFARDDLAGLKRTRAGDSAGPEPGEAKLSVPVGEFGRASCRERVSIDV